MPVKSLRDPKNGLLVMSPLEDEGALRLLQEKGAAGDTFALTLYRTYHEIRKYKEPRGERLGWTEPQRAWGHLLAMRMLSAKNSSQPAAPRDLAALTASDHMQHAQAF